MSPAGRGGPATAPVVRLDGYEGPLDFLLDLARAQKVDLARLSIGTLVDQYVAAVEAPGAGAGLSARGDWLIAASWLVLLRSRLLVHGGEEEPLPEAERLREGLLRAGQRGQARALAGWLERRPQLGREVFARGAPEAVPAEASGEGGDLLDLLLACSDLLEVRAGGTQGSVAPYAPPVPDVWSLAEALARLRAGLAARPRGGALGLFLPEAGDGAVSALRRRSGVAGTFVAALELARQGGLDLRQERDFDEIHLTVAGQGVEQAA